MTGRNLTQSISLSNILSLLVMLVTGAIAFGSLSMTIDAYAETLSDHEARLRVIENNVAPALARIDERLLQLQQQLQEIKRAQTP